MATVETVKIVFDVESKELTDTTKQLVDLGKVVDDDAAKFKKLNAEAGNSEKAFTSLRTQVKQAKDEVVRLSDEFGEFSAEANAARARAGQLADQMSDLNRQVNLLNPEAKAKAFTNFGQGVVGAFQVATGALQAFGAENEEVQKIAMRLQGALNVVQGIASIKQLKEAYQDVKVVLGVTTAAQNTLNGATAAGGAAAGGAATGFRALTAAMVANPFTAVAVAIGALVGAIVLFNKNTEKSIANAEALKNAQDANVESTEKLTDALNKLAVIRGEKTQEAVDKEKLQEESLKRQVELKKVLADAISEQLNAQKEFNELGKGAFPPLIEERRLRLENAKIAVKSATEALAAEKAALLVNKQLIDEKNKSSNKSIENKKEDVKIREEEVKTTDDLVKKYKELQDQFNAARASNAAIEQQRAKEIASQLSEIDQQAALEKENNLAIYYGKENILRDLNIASEQNAIDEKLALLKQYGEQDTIEYQTLLARRVQLNKEAEANQTKDFEDAEKERDKIRKENIDAAAQFATEGYDFIFNLQKEGLQREQDELAFQKEQGIITEEQYQEKLKAIKIRQAKDNKQAAIFQATTDFALALLNALTFKPATAVPAALIATTAIAGLNLAKVIATPLPKFKDGTLNFQGGKMDSDGGALAILHPNEAVIPADRNMAYHPTLEAIYKKQIKPSELNAFVLNKLAGKGSIGRDTQITASVDTYALSRAMSRNKGVEVTNAQMIGAAVANELSKRINPRQVI